MRNIPFSPPDITDREIKSVVEVLKSGWITTGPKTKEFEKKISEYCGTEKTICMNSATACMEMCLRLLGVGPGDEVITSSYTYTASASVIAHVGAKIVLVDTENDSYHLSIDALEKAITPRTKVIIPVDIAGVMCDYDRLFKLVEDKKKLFSSNNDIQAMYDRIIILADGAHSFGATYKGRQSGTIADFTSFSFHAVKNLTTAEGGALTWKSLDQKADELIYRTMNTLSLHGQTKDALAKNKLGSWEYDIVEPAFKCNMTDIQAALGLIQLERYPKLLSKRKTLIELYESSLKEVNQVTMLSHYTEKYTSSGHLFLIGIRDSDEQKRNQIIMEMAEKGIATNVHYKPLPLLTAYKKMGFKMTDYPNAYNMYRTEITLPLNTKMTENDIVYVAEKLISSIGGS
ncbi:DegT/DnrJ/EryC1/StrS family aminotransferase [Enterococcus crotali]|uniref:DegT/DnrJ/EryC1/StrS family aminotransferase n=1 Tax=Enterococcus crotali TaxID=1453587 RepID=UPI00047021D1|nr:DegT/DnrJ/EryC1/StrS family aminotransferase [Enterococcus crotali]